MADGEAAVGGQGIAIHLEAVVLRRDVNPSGALVEHGMVGTSVPELQSAGGRSRRKAQELVAQADANQWQPVAHDRAAGGR